MAYCLLLLCTAALCMAYTPAIAQAGSSHLVTSYPFIIGYHISFGSEGIAGHHLNLGIGLARMYRSDSDDTLTVNEPGGLIATATVEIGLSHGRLVVTPLVSGYVAGGIAFGFSAGIATDGSTACALLRPAFGVGLIIPWSPPGFLLTYGYSLTLPWNQDLLARSIGSIDIPTGAWQRIKDP